MKRKWIALWIVLNFVVFWFVGLYTSGYSLEGYLPWESEKISEYSPIVYTKPDDRPAGILYMADMNGDLYYYIVWDDEYFSNAIIDKLYRFFRGLVYGGATQDIEVVRVNPDNGSFYFQTYGHTNVHGKLLANNECLWIEENKVIPDCAVNGTHIRVYVVTWNHMLSLIPENDTVRAVLPMRHMTPDDYIALGMFRRTQHTIAGVAFDSMALALLMTGLFNVVLYFSWKRGWLTRNYYKKVREETRRGKKRLEDEIKR
jgi:hypothetical protein